jgi:hypothetical protein
MQMTKLSAFDITPTVKRFFESLVHTPHNIQELLGMNKNLKITFLAIFILSGPPFINDINYYGM